MFYRWIIIENSLKDKGILKKYRVISETKFAEGDLSGRESRMLKIRIPEKDINKLINLLRKNIKHPFYTHFYHEDPKINKLIVVFEGKIINTGKNNFQRAIDYGITHGVTREEMNISPRDVLQEDW